MTKAQQVRFQSLYQLHLSALTRQGKSESTIESYSRALRRIADFFDRCPDKLTRADLQGYFSSLIKSHSWSTVKIDRNGLQFFYKHVLNKQWEWLDIVKPPVERKLPDILTQAEIQLILNSTYELRYQTYLLTAYTLGLRLGEALNLTVADIDAQRSRVHIRQGKGRKDRFVILPNATLMALRRYWSTHRHPALIFPAGKNALDRRNASEPMSRSGVQHAFQAIVKSCGIQKQVSIHTLRHCYGTHLLEAGVAFRAIQQAMGHQHLKTTALYTQLTETVQQNAAELINELMSRLLIQWQREV
jgi:site-specific recombinase XerD